MNQPKYFVRYLDVRKKWLDNTKTTVELIFKDWVGTECVLAYVHTDEDISKAKENESMYIDLMLSTIKENIGK